MNQILVIYPYKQNGVWVFDDGKVGLIQEPFVSGADVIIDRMVEGIPKAHEGFSLFFSANPFPGYQGKFEWRREEFEGNWYYSAELDLEGWLCPAMFKYFEVTPQEIYTQCKPKVSA